jgi:hypothetical protein
MPADATLRCPSCRRANQIDPDRTVALRCARCHCELEPLALIRAAAEGHTRNACDALANDDFAGAARLATQSWALMPAPETAACGLLAAINRGDLPAAAYWRQRLHSPPAS